MTMVSPTNCPQWTPVSSDPLSLHFCLLQEKPLSLRTTGIRVTKIQLFQSSHKCGSVSGPRSGLYSIACKSSWRVRLPSCGCSALNMYLILGATCFTKGADSQQEHSSLQKNAVFVSVKGQIVNTLGFVGRVASGIITPLCPCRAKATIHNT